MVEPLQIAGRRTWLKQHDGERRWLALAALDLGVRLLGLRCLRPPPRLKAEQACQLERRRLRELAAHGVPVPCVLGHGETALLLEDGGPSLAQRLRCCGPGEAEHLMRLAANELLRVHWAGCCVGQPVARNIAVDEAGCVRFLDLEERSPAGDGAGRSAGARLAAVHQWECPPCGAARRRAGRRDRPLPAADRT